MDAGVLATVLLIVGLFLIALELMIPSFGIIGIAAGICLVISLWSAGQAWWGTSPGFFWTYTTFLILGIPGVTGGMLFVLQTTPLGKRVILQSPTLESVTPLSKVRNELSELIGETGTAASLLTPGGMVEVKGRRYHAESVGMMVEPQTPIEVVGVRGTRVVVRPKEENASAQNSDSSKTSEIASSVSAAAPLDTVDAGNLSDSEDLKVTEVSEQPSAEPSADMPNDDTGSPKKADSNDGILDFQIPEEYTP